MTAKKRLLWIGDAVMPTGFARVTHNVVAHLLDDYDVTVLGIGYNGDPHPFPYPIYPAKTRNSEDQWGIARLPALLPVLKPDLIVVNNDPWNVIRFPESGCKVPVIGYMPVDAPNMLNDVAKRLHQVASAVFYTEFGLNTARVAGYKGDAIVVPHGVDTNFYSPMSKECARTATGHRLDSFVIGNVNRNQPRKRLDLSIMAFARWVREYNIPPNVYLHLHCCKKDCGWDLSQLARYFNVQDRVWFTDQRMEDNLGIEEAAMPYIYNSFDMQISTTSGEGWGLTTMEGMACGVPQVVPEWSALAEWAAGAVRYVPIRQLIATTDRINSIAALVDEDAMVRAIDYMYRHADVREEYGRLARQRVTEEHYRWDVIAARLSRHIADVLSGVRGKPTLAVESAVIANCGPKTNGLNRVAAHA